jgi:sec-independent protein translocase protein TatB
VSFPHLLVIFVIALVVLGPQKMPKLVAEVGRWVGKARAMARQFREQLENEINLDELTRTGSKPAQKTPAPDEYASPTWPPGAPPTATPAAEAAPADVATVDATTSAHVEPDTQHHDTSHVEAAAMSDEALAAGQAATPEPAWTSDVHDNRLHPPAAPEAQSSTPIIETHERGV